jgi:D-glycero-alpha-D-manno-heptose-7-phosphate kinase
MIISRTPLRVSIGGGGTDLPSYYQDHGGFVISAAINKHIYITLHNRTFTADYSVKYSQLERVSRAEDIQHRILREAFVSEQIPPGVELVSIADLPSGTGLGSSGSFTVGVLRALYAMKRQHVTTHQLAEAACSIEIDRLKEPVGKQDQYIAAFGGLSCFEIDKAGRVTVTPLQIPQDALHDLEDHLLMFFTGYSRSASAVLADQKTKSEAADKGMLDNLHFIKDLGFQIREHLEAGNTHKFAECMHTHWLRKKERSSGISNQQINDWYDVGKANGALGGKLIGAGGGGFLLFYATDAAQLRKAMAGCGLSEVRFFFDQEGSKIIVQE